MSITTAQIRGARGILNWSQGDLAERTGISATSIGSIENNQTKPRANTLSNIQRAFEDAGIEFMGQDGVRLKTGNVRVFTGREGYMEFFNEVYDLLSKEKGGDICVSNVDERKFAKWHGELGEEHLARMKSLQNVKTRILIQDGDTYFPADGYAEYRWLSKELFSSVPFYVFGKKLAIMLFDIEPTIILLNYPAVAQTYRKQFEAMWSNSTKPELSKKEAV